ncbi:hypothetical protein BU25DRAFT_75854 [Macroventuria anomochaeta]|uniref:Uncharacterized protein n=1 Tax=Macroventuria anomochaeta TaxID=301207 RepID=A0ACB6RYV2_9PLEO|nr:uncharacterized protein BU25DRAFT_75854 [Macroventuria anomochaeta]KAF2626959.1 hypothetical protein BU25DRAFT_75854 [Macroventuria anomochaeta]
MLYQSQVSPCAFRKPALTQPSTSHGAQDSGQVRQDSLGMGLNIEQYVESSETASPEVPENKQFVARMHDLQCRQQMLDSIYMRAIEKKKKSDTDVTQALERMQISPPQPDQGQASTNLTLDLKVVSKDYDLGPKVTKTLPRKINVVQTRAIHQIYVSASECDVEKDRAFQQVTQYAENSGPCPACN